MSEFFEKYKRRILIGGGVTILALAALGARAACGSVRSAVCGSAPEQEEVTPPRAPSGASDYWRKAKKK